MEPAKPPVTEEEIDAAKDLKAVRLLAKRFENEVSLKKCTLPKMKLRLKLALQKMNGKMKDLDALGHVMTDRRKNDRDHREMLFRYFVKMKEIVTNIDQNLKRHLANEYKNINEKIEMFMKQLKNPADKIVVAGETSSGKSTLLNIFLADDEQEETLPVKLLSCTATMCEIQYSQQRTAAVVTKGKEEQVPFGERNKYIYKESERERKFPHELVRLKMPVSFLKSGVSLVDSPGIGESTEMGTVIKDYVLRNDVFGFIFTIASSRAGGVLNKFLNLLRTLASDEYADQYGQRKLDPRCCMFVANFWDEVSEDNKEETKEHIFKKLGDLPFMRGFRPHDQIFFLDAGFAYSSMAEGYITKDFAHLIDGMGTFVFNEQKRKLKDSYDWLVNVLQRILHPIQGLIRNMTQTQNSRQKNKDALTRKLDEVERKFRTAWKECKDRFEVKKSICISDLLEYMESKEAKQMMGKWKLGDMPTEEPDDNWVIIEMKLDEAIDERVADLMQEWEKKGRSISNAERDLTEYLTFHSDVFSNELEDIERDIRITGSKLKESLVEESSPGTDVFTFPKSPTKTRDFSVNFGQSHGSDIMKRKQETESILGSFSNGPAMRALKFAHKKSPGNDESYRVHKLKYMEERSLNVYSEMCTREYVSSVVKNQFAATENFMQHMEVSIMQVIKSNRNLLHQIAEERRNKQAVENEYSPVEKQLQELFEDVLALGNRLTMGNDFQSKDLENQLFQFKPHSLFVGHMPNKITVTAGSRVKLKQPETVTLRKFEGQSKATLRLSERFFHAKSLRQFKTNPYTPELLGTCTVGREYILVLDGSLSPARKSVLQNKRQSVMKFPMKTQFRENKEFLNQLSQALLFLHLKKLVHCEFSLDSVMMKTQGIHQRLPMLCNLSEPTMVHASLQTDDPLGQHLHIPLEVLQKKECYTQESDMYGLGIIMIELCYQTDVFAEIKEMKRFGDWCKVEDRGQALLEEAKKTEKKMPPKWKELAKKCLKNNPAARISIRQWLNEWIDVVTESLPAQ